MAMPEVMIGASDECIAEIMLAADGVTRGMCAAVVWRRLWTRLGLVFSRTWKVEGLGQPWRGR